MENAPDRKPAPVGASIARITSKGQMTVPKAVRDFLGLKAGDAVIISMLGPDVTMRRITPLSEWDRPPLPEGLLDLTEEQKQEILDVGRRQRWREKMARELPQDHLEDDGGGAPR